MQMEFKWLKPVSQIADEACGGAKTYLAMANEFRRVMQPYVPRQQGVLAGNVTTYTEGSVGVVEYNSPYARFQYEGVVMIGRRSKSPWARKGESKMKTGRALSYSNGIATSKWDKAAWAAHSVEFTQRVQSIINGG